MQISIEKTLVRNLTFKGSLNESSDSNERTFNVNFEQIYLESNSKSFIIRFNVTVTNAGEFDIDIIYDAVFNTNEDVDKEFKNSHFPNINAPAIAYPFLRSYISFLTLNSGFDPAILPTINFVDFLKTPKETNENPML